MDSATGSSGYPIWIELSTTDQEEGARFYSAVFGLTPTEPVVEFGGYRTLTRPEGPIAGVMGTQGSAESSWVVYLETADIEATARAIEANGRKLEIAPHAVADLGSMAFFIDPSGAWVGLWQPDTHHGIAVRDVPGTPCWFELHTARDYADTVEFYRAVFGWEPTTIGDADDFRMVVVGEEGAEAAGIYDASRDGEGPSAWRVYFAVADADAAAATIREHGGALEGDVEDTPYGRTGTAHDPTGARFSFLRPPD